MLESATMTFYRKKKRKVGPSKNEEKVRRGQAAEAEESAAGTLSSRVPGARSLKLKIAIVSPQGVVLEEEDMTLGAGDPFVIGADCAGACGSGSFDFGPLVADALSNGRKSGTAEIACPESGYGAGTACGCVAKLSYSAE